MPSLAFIVPVHGRISLAAICLRQLRRTCDALAEAGLDASAVVISDRQTLRRLPDLGFAEAVRDNYYLSRKFNDGIQLATDPAVNRKPVDFVVPCGSDDWVDYRLFLDPLPARNEIHGFQWMSFVREDGRQICAAYLNYVGGSGIRIIPRQLVARLDYRPADEDRHSACDTSILRNIRVCARDELDVKHFHIHNRQIVDWKSGSHQLNSYANVLPHATAIDDDPFGALAEFYPAEALEEMERHYLRAKVPA